MKPGPKLGTPLSPEHRRKSIQALIKGRAALAAKPRTPVAVRFWTKVEKTPTCWIWTGAQDRHGYGYFHFGKRNEAVKAYRMAYELAVGPIPEGMHVLHRCDNPPCVNPAHLFIGTHRDNMQDSWRKDRYDHEKHRISQRERMKNPRIYRAAVANLLAPRPTPTHCRRGHPYSKTNLKWSGGKRRCHTCSLYLQRERRRAAAKGVPYAIPA